MEQVEGDSFAQFWSLYPRRIGRASAIKAWNRLRPDVFLVKELMDRLSLFVDEDWKGKDPQYIPHPASWLNGRRWEDMKTQPLTKPEPEAEGRPLILTGLPKFEEPTPAEREEGKRILRECREKIEASLDMRARFRIRNKLAAMNS